MDARIVLLPGDGIGPEVVNETRLVLDKLASLFGHTFSFDTQPIGGNAIDDFGDPLPQQTIDACKRAMPSSCRSRSPNNSPRTR